MAAAAGRSQSGGEQAEDMERRGLIPLDSAFPRAFFSPQGPPQLLLVEHIELVLFGLLVAVAALAVVAGWCGSPIRSC